MSGSHHCAGCASGRYHESAGQQTCKVCEAGRFQPKRESTTCNDCNYNCDKGQFHSGCGGAVPGSCKLCKAGQYKAARDDARQCTLCGAGKFQDTTGADGHMTLPRPRGA